MRLHPPPGRAGRLWLLRRLAVARRGQDVLEQKRQALVRRQAELSAELAAAAADWESDVREAAVWWQRAAVLAGERTLQLAAGAVPPTADVRIAWRNALGTSYPAETTVVPPERPGFPAGGSAALTAAADAYRRALESGARLGAAQVAHARVEEELRRTSQRLRAIERRWVPAHEETLRRLELALEESEREDAVRVRWVTGRAR
ncbi:MAG: V-type ATP synthase subunit D [Gaiellaceae bacterium]